MDHLLDLQGKWTPELVRQAKIVKLKKDFLGSAIFVAILSIGLIAFTTVYAGLNILLFSFSLSYVLGWSLLVNDRYQTALWIYFISPFLIILLFGTAISQLRFEGLLFIPLIVDTFNYIDDKRQKILQLIAFSLGAFTCLMFDMRVDQNDISNGFSIASFLLLFTAIGFTAANIQNLLNAPSSYIMKLLNAQNTIKTNQDKFERIFQNTIEGIFIYNVGTQEIINSNPAFYKMIGNNRAESIDILFNDLDLRRLKRMIFAVVESQISRNLDLQIRSNTDEGLKLLDVETTIIPYDLKHNLVAISLHNITDRIAAYRDKAESEALYHSLLETSSAGIIQTDLEGNIKFVSASGASILNLDRKELLDQQVQQVFSRFLSREELLKLPKYWKGLLETGTVRLPHFKIKSERLGQKHLEGTVKYLKNADDENVGFLIVYNDISRLMESQAKLMENGLIFHSLLANSFDGVDVLELGEAQGHLEGRLIMRNRQMINILGDNDKSYLRFNEFKELLGDLEPQMLELRKDEFYQNKKEIIENKELQVVNSFIINGQKRYVHCSYQVLEIVDKVFLIRVYNDITKQKEQEIEILEKNDELKNYIESNISLSNFAAIASHDLKAPLRTINSFAQLINQKESNNLSSAGRDYLKLILDSSSHLKNLIEDILSFSRVDTNNLLLETHDPYRIVCSLLDEVKSDIEQTGTIIELEDFPEQITCDRLKIGQVLSNLIRNGMKFQNPNNTAKIQIGCQETSKYWRFYVTDNGIGIREMDKEKIFKLFGRLHSQDEFDGSGIGLAICSKIVKSHRGSLSVESVYGNGSTFSFTIRKNLKSIPNLV